MPSLLDLAPELLENIAQYLLHENDQAHMHLAALRLSCRPVEAAIRRTFRLKYFRSVNIRKPKDANIEKFCAISKVPDLAKSIWRIGICCADDGTAEHDARSVVRQRNSPQPSDGTVELLGRSRADQLVPAALISHKEALLTALLATENVVMLEFADCHWNLSASDDTEREYLDLPAPRPRSGNGLLGFVCDISSTFNFIMSLIARAGLAPKWISIGSLHDLKLVTGLTTTIGLVTYKQALLQLKSLQLVFVNESGSDEAVGTIIGQQLYDCLYSLPLLETLSLNFNVSGVSRFALDIFSKGSMLPTLRQLDLRNCKVSVKIFSHFLLKHCNTLVGLALGFVGLEDGSLEDIRGFLGILRGSAGIEYLSIVMLRLNGDLIGFNLPSRAIGVDCEDEEEYVLVSMTASEFVSFEGTTEVRNGLMMMEEWVTVTLT